MNKQATTPLRLPLWMAGIAAILVSGIAVGSLAISARDANGFFTPAKAVAETVLSAIPASEVRSDWCADCGVIVSTREIETRSEKSGLDKTPTRIFETVVRRRDGSTLVINDLNQATWRKGERVKLIGGMD